LKEVSMRIVQWVLMVLGWWSAGLLLSSRVIPCGQPVQRSTEFGDIVCPKLSLKCYIAAFIAVAYGLLWFFAFGLKMPVPLGEYVVSAAMGAILGAAFARILCPKPI